VPDIAHRLKIMTYHSFAARFLRSEIHHLGYPRSFTILDDEDQLKIVKTIAVEQGYRRGDDIVKQSMSYISSNKSKGILPESINIVQEKFVNEKVCLSIYQSYENKLQQMANLDFDDLLIKAIIVLQNFPDVQRRWQQKFLHILIDEFQDTNDIQHTLLNLLMTSTTSLYVVGDPDQTIYSWRGANQAIMLELDKKYPIETIILNQNYRSTQTILNLANTLIEHNHLRVKKDLFSTNKGGDPIVVNRLANHEEEARWVIQDIQKQIRERQVSLKDIVILYRANYLTLPFEKELNRLGVAYKIFGGMRFYQRKEIKDVLAYFKLLINELDDVSFERIINVPRRGIGDKTIELLKVEALKQKLSFVQYIRNLASYTSDLKEKTTTQLTRMVALIDRYTLTLKANDELFSESLRQYLDDMGYLQSLKEEDDEEGRLENVQTLFSDMENFIKENNEAGFEGYLENVALTSSQDELDNDAYVSLMTIHTAKGLEFDYVYVIGLNEGVFPSLRTMDEHAYLGLEEERRLCYVAFTRAKLHLSLSCSADYSFVISGNLIPSRFFKDAGISFAQVHPTTFETKRMGSIQSVAPSIPERSKPKEIFASGDRIKHEAFGIGEVLTVIDQSIIEVKFKEVGIKKLIAHHPKITKLYE
jgi:DNA helicase-2/ATP-dependent DNA helicase PcrA